MWKRCALLDGHMSWSNQHQCNGGGQLPGCPSPRMICVWRSHARCASYSAATCSAALPRLP